MRRIFTQSIALVCMLAIAGSSFAQTTCSTSENDPGTLIGSTLSITSGSSFAVTNPGSQFNHFNDGANSTTLTSPTYFFNSPSNVVTFQTNLRSLANATNGSSQITSYSISIVYGTGANQVTVPCSNTTPFNVSNVAGGTVYYFSITNSSNIVPISTNFVIKLTLNIRNSDQDIAATGFRTNANLAGGTQATLPVRFSGLNAKVLSNGNVSLVWNVDAEENLKGYEVERSADGVRFASIGTVAAAGQHSYSFVDAAALATAYYRIRSVDVDGKAGYSTIASVKGGQSSIVVKGFMSSPNTLIVQHDAALKGSSIVVSSGDGRIVRSVLPQVGAQQTSIDLSVAGKGLYIVRYEAANGEVSTVKFIKQ